MKTEAFWPTLLDGGEPLTKKDAAMLQRVKKILGDKLGASDGELGHIKDVYFDDKSWAVRYLVADTGSWLPGRQVLIPPHAFGSLYQPGKLLLVNLTRKQVENSPSIESHKPLSRRFEEEYYQYYGWPNYWQGDALSGVSAIPLMPPPSAGLPEHEVGEAHLQSAQGMNGYRLYTTNGMAGHVDDFIIDDKIWAISHLGIKLDSGSSVKEAMIPSGFVGQINPEESKVTVRLTTEAVEQFPAPDLNQVDASH